MEINLKIGETLIVNLVDNHALVMVRAGGLEVGEVPHVELNAMDGDGEVHTALHYFPGRNDEDEIEDAKVVNALGEPSITWEDVAVEFGCEVHDSNCFDPLELPDGVRSVVSGIERRTNQPMRISNVFLMKCRDTTSTAEDQEVTAIIREKGEHLCIIAYKDKNGIIHFP